MSTGEASPSFIEKALAGLGTNCICNQRIVWSAPRRLAAREKIGPWSSRCILDHVRQEVGQDDRYQKPKHRALGLLHTRAHQGRPRENDHEWNHAGNNHHPN